ncbi:LysR family transcriptional regulator [Acetobacter oeni]|uniref:LysR family transcriptional regulator n=1 Tax=Acetobacter oeni TaxID=304077 RepID=A0A511XJC5_9PROT|nr:LysR family transcriptional regulator [Acetobacter oeni]MBB3882766.1 DNA-binding transcriptional LysR family regulator [Acetobacter oeni]NHO18858.1 LysR family transcriptional regulator [Acetobacter oeni]GBR06427.1 LysR family transcriptional regulator [Acetobacter oeni LMG 21952]GEN63047.1 LysR family transcriptional regulator [Acetobacter oeni]
MSSDETGDLRFFTSLVDAGSLTACARNLGNSPAAISRRLSRLEARLGSTLIIRNTRHFGLSETGRVYYERALNIVADIDRLEDEISSSARAPKGTLSIGAPVELGRRQIAPFIETFSAKHPKLTISLALASEGVYDLSDYLDVVLRLGLPEAGGAMVTRLASTMRVLCASPDYIARRSLPAHPRDLTKHDCLCLRRNKTMALLNKWTIGNEQETDVVTVEPRLSTTNAEIIHDWALSGQGIAYKLLCDVCQDLEDGKLIRIFPDLQGERIDLYAVLPDRQHTRAGVRAFLNDLRPYFRTAGFLRD